ncbi:MAG TPA: hypothetical protein VLB80_01955 [Candidatus Babeliales bacterium]|nr:hypothetical protein [Candidatus Babeliales bacterium]
MKKIYAILFIMIYNLPLVAMKKLPTHNELKDDTAETRKYILKRYDDGTITLTPANDKDSFAYPINLTQNLGPELAYKYSNKYSKS